MRWFLLALLLLSGCSAEYWTGRIKPEFKLKFNPISKTVEVYDSKDDIVEIEGLEFDAKTKAVKVATVKVQSLSKSVIDADAARMQYVIEAQRVQVEYQQQLGMNLAMAIAAGGDAASKFISVIPKIEWPGGGVTPAPCPVGGQPDVPPD